MAARDQWIRHALFAGVVLLALGAVWLFNAGDGLSGASGGASVELTGERGTVRPALDGFERIRLKVPAEVDITAGGSFGVSLSADRAVLERIEARVENGTLIVAPKPGDLRLRNAHVAIRVTLPTLSALRVDGAVEGGVEGIGGGDFALTVNGAADLDLGGRCERFDLTVNGAASIAARSLKCADVRVTLNGAGNTSVYASRAVRARLNGVGNVVVYGHPAEVEAHKGGFGRIELRDDEEDGASDGASPHAGG